MNWTDAERFGIRQMLDCGAVSVKPGADTLAKYKRLRMMGYVDAHELPKHRILIVLTAHGRKMLRAAAMLGSAA
jgi:hypothetical protein